MKGPHFLWRAETIVGLYCVLPGGGEILREGDGANFFGCRLPRAPAAELGYRRSNATGRRETCYNFRWSVAGGSRLLLDAGRIRKIGGGPATAYVKVQ